MFLEGLLSSSLPLPPPSVSNAVDPARPPLTPELVHRQVRSSFSGRVWGSLGCYLDAMILVHGPGRFFKARNSDGKFWQRGYIFSFYKNVRVGSVKSELGVKIGVARHVLKCSVKIWVKVLFWSKVSSSVVNAGVVLSGCCITFCRVRWIFF